jgi:hypothetical protein
LLAVVVTFYGWSIAKQRREAYRRSEEEREKIRVRLEQVVSEVWSDVCLYVGHMAHPLNEALEILRKEP